MATESDDVLAASMDLVRSLAEMARALDAVGDDTEACQHVSFRIPLELERLATRINSGLRV